MVKFLKLLFVKPFSEVATAVSRELTKSCHICRFDMSSAGCPIHSDKPDDCPFFCDSYKEYKRNIGAFEKYISNYREREREKEREKEFQKHIENKSW